MQSNGAEAIENDELVNIIIIIIIIGRNDRHVCFHFEDENGKEIQMYDEAHFSDGVSQPILSSGKLLEGGWSIDGSFEASKQEPDCRRLRLREGDCRR